MRTLVIGLGALALGLALRDAPSKFQQPHTWNSQGF
jgi:hypothetical protein